MTIDTHTVDDPAHRAPDAGGAIADLEALCEPGSLRLFDSPEARAAAPAIYAGVGQIGHRPVFAYASNGSVSAGALGSVATQLLADTVERGASLGAAVVGLLHTAGAKLGEGAASLDGFATAFSSLVAARRRVPLISVVLGPCAGGGCYAASLTDVTVMSSTSAMFLTGPKVVREAIGEETTREDLGGPQVHGGNGVATFVAGDPADAIALARRVVLLLAPPTRAATGAEPPGRPARHLPPTARAGYDMRAVVADVVDDGELLEAHTGWGPSVTTALARIGGQAVGVVASQPSALNGVITADAAIKAAGFVRLCGRRSLPLVVFVDTPGFMPGRREEARGVIRAGAELVSAFVEATVPKVTVIVRRAIGGGYIAMCSRGLGADAVVAWPEAEIGIMGARQSGALSAKVTSLVSAEQARRDGSVDAVVAPEATRRFLIDTLARCTG